MLRSSAVVNALRRQSKTVRESPSGMIRSGAVIMMAGWMGGLPLSGQSCVEPRMAAVSRPRLLELFFQELIVSGRDREGARRRESSQIERARRLTCSTARL